VQTANGYSLPGGTIAVRSATGHLRLRQLYDRHWHDLGGHLISTPAQVAARTRHFYVAEHADHSLWIRSRTQGWQPAAAATLDCRQPAAVLHDGLMTVACLGASGTIHTSNEQLAPRRLPFFSRWKSLGESSSYGPAVGWLDGELTWFAIAGNGHATIRIATTRWAQLPWSCAGPPAISTSTQRGSWFACVAPNGNALMVRHAAGTWRKPVDLAQPAVGRVAVVDGWNGDVGIFIVTPRGEAWCRSLRSTWQPLGGGNRAGLSLALP
jgi:hypothetical protein